MSEQRAIRRIKRGLVTNALILGILAVVAFLSGCAPPEGRRPPGAATAITAQPAGGIGGAKGCGVCLPVADASLRSRLDPEKPGEQRPLSAAEAANGVR